MKPLKFLAWVIAFTAMIVVSVQAEILSFGWTDPNPPGAATGYNLYQSTNIAGPFAIVATSTTTTASLTNAPSAALWFYVTCFNARGESPKSNVVSLQQLLSAPTGFRVTVIP